MPPPPGEASPTPTISSDSSHSCEEVSGPDIIPPISHTSVKFATLPTIPFSTPSHPIHTIHCSVFSRPRSSDNTICESGPISSSSRKNSTVYRKRTSSIDSYIKTRIKTKFSDSVPCGHFILFDLCVFKRGVYSPCPYARR